MKRYSKEKIYDLLPSIYKIRDKENGEPLKALLEIIGEQVELLEEDIAKLYNNWFIETCDEWLIPYIGDLLKVKILNPITKTSTFSHRSWVANTISYRRRKGTIATLEQLSRDVTGWNSKAVEFFQNLITFQYMNHVRQQNIASINLRDANMLELIDTPFDKTAHTIDVRHINSKKGYHNIPNIGIFLWRLQAYPVINSPAFSVGNGRYTFNQLGYDSPLYNHPETETGIDHIATEINVPTPIRRKALENALINYRTFKTNFIYEKSLKIVKTSIVNGESKESQILPDDILVCDLHNWNHAHIPLGKVAIDPVLGRILFSKDEEIKDVHVTYYYGFSGDIGGGFYDRIESRQQQEQKEQEQKVEFLINESPDIYYYKISKRNREDYNSLNDAYKEWENEVNHNSWDVIFEVVDSEVYEGENEIPLEIKIPQKIKMTIRSITGQRPIFKLKKSITVKGDSRSKLTLDGIVFTTFNRNSKNHSNLGLNYDNKKNIILNIAEGNLNNLDINHCTFVPGLSEEENLGRKIFTWSSIPGNSKDEANLKNYLYHVLDQEWIIGEDASFKDTANNNNNNNNNRLLLSTSRDSILLELNSESKIVSIKISEKNKDRQNYKEISKIPIAKNNNSFDVYSCLYSITLFGKNNHSLQISLNKSIIGRIHINPNSRAYIKIFDSIVDGKGTIDVLKSFKAHIQNSTIYGKISNTILEYANNTIFTDYVIIERRQIGCVRFCFISDGSFLPRTYRCIFEYSNDDDENVNSINVNMKKQSRIRPTFTSMRYGDPGYGQLHRNVQQKIFEGGENSLEMGVFNYLSNPQRLRNLQLSINEYLKFGLETGIFLVT